MDEELEFVKAYINSWEDYNCAYIDALAMDKEAAENLKNDFLLHKKLGEIDEL